MELQDIIEAVWGEHNAPVMRQAHYHDGHPAYVTMTGFDDEYLAYRFDLAIAGGQLFMRCSDIAGIRGNVPLDASQLNSIEEVADLANTTARLLGLRQRQL